MNINIYIFDVDGTLTPARKPMADDFAKIFTNFLAKNTCYIVSGSDLDKIQEQVKESILNKFAGIFCSMANELYIQNKLIYSNSFTPKQNLISDLEEMRKNTKYPNTLHSNYIEIRKGMLNFSILGRNCKEQDRQNYYQWDIINQERESIKAVLESKYQDIYDISIGGQISIDITPKNQGKEQSIPDLRKIYPNNKFIFCGDRIKEGGNDYYIARYCQTIDNNSQVIEVSSPEYLLKVLNLV